MVNNAAFKFWIIYVSPLIFHRGLGTGPGTSHDRDWAIQAYNLETDLCLKITLHSSNEIKKEAALLCKEAFEALDRLEENLCHGWREAACREIAGFEQLLCSCKISTSDSQGITSDKVSSFRECAWTLQAAELLTNQTPAPSKTFKRKHDNLDRNARKKPRHHKIGSRGSSRSSPAPDSVPSVRPVHAPGKRPLICSYCGRGYKTKKILEDHQKSHETDLRCTECVTTYSNRANYNKHMRKFHKKQVSIETGSTSANPAGVEDGSNVIFKCDICGKDFQWRTSLVAHRRMHKEKTSCEICNAPYSTRANCIKHLKTSHPEFYEAQEARILAERQFECELCKECFASKRVLAEHAAFHRGETICKACKITFPRKSELRIHDKKVHKPKTKPNPSKEKSTE